MSNRSCGRIGAVRVFPALSNTPEPIIGNLTGNTCTALGVVVTDNAPVLALCRRLIEAGHDPASPLHAYRGSVLALRVRSIGEGAKLEVNSQGSGFILRPARAPRAASPVRQNDHPLSPPPKRKRLRHSDVPPHWAAKAKFRAARTTISTTAKPVARSPASSRMRDGPACFALFGRTAQRPTS